MSLFCLTCSNMTSSDHRLAYTTEKCQSLKRFQTVHSLYNIYSKTITNERLRRRLMSAPAKNNNFTKTIMQQVRCSRRDSSRKRNVSNFVLNCRHCLRNGTITNGLNGIAVRLTEN